MWSNFGHSQNKYISSVLCWPKDMGFWNTLGTPINYHWELGKNMMEPLEHIENTEFQKNSLIEEKVGTHQCEKIQQQTEVFY